MGNNQSAFNFGRGWMSQMQEHMPFVPARANQPLPIGSLVLVFYYTRNGGDLHQAVTIGWLVSRKMEIEEVATADWFMFYERNAGEIASIPVSSVVEVYWAPDPLPVVRDRAHVLEMADDGADMGGTLVGDGVSPNNWPENLDQFKRRLFLRWMSRNPRMPTDMVREMSEWLDVSY